MPYTVVSILLKVSLVVPFSLPTHILHSFKARGLAEFGNNSPKTINI